MAIHDKKANAAKEAFKAATKLIDRLAQRNIISTNKAARTKSRLNARVKACE